MRTLGVIEGEPITERDDESVQWFAKAAIDADGSGKSHGDPCWQNDTSLHQDGKPLNADEDKFIVVPPLIIDSVKGVVLGCQAHVKNHNTRLETDAVVGDIGPPHKLGELSIACARALGIDSSPVDGGEDAHVVEYVIYPSAAAKVDGKQYSLQPKQ